MDPKAPEQTEPEQAPAPAAEPSEPARDRSPREIALSAIKVRRDSEPEPAQPAEEPAQEQVAAQANPEPVASADDQLAQQLADDSRVLSDGLDKIKVKVKVDGVEQEVSVADMQRSYQIESAARRRLDEANRLLAEQRARDQAQASPPGRVDGQDPPADSPTQSKPKGIGKDEAKKLVTALLDGDEDTAVEMVEKVAGRTDGPIQDPDQLAAQLTPVIRQQLRDESALDKFGKDYPEIAGDQHLARVTDSFVAEEMKGGKSFPEALEVAGQRTRDWVSSKVPKTAPILAPTMNREQKLERKASIDPIPALNKTASTDEPPAKTRSSVIAEMRKARGLEV